MPATLRRPATARARRPGVLGAAPAGPAPVVAALAVAAASLALAAVLRSRHLGAGLWVDEGIAIGIARHGLTDIPRVLAQDGSPPFYYLLLHVWGALFGWTEGATHALSFVLALLVVPAALWAGWSLSGPRAGAYTTALAASVPFLTVYAQETRMYALVVLLALLAAAAFAHAFLARRRRWAPVFAVLLAALMYTHNWGLFLAAGSAVALVPVLVRRRDRALGRDAALAFGGALALYAPWVPTLLSQVRHTGAPWAATPTPGSALGDVAWTWSTPAALLVLAGVVLAAWMLRHDGGGDGAGEALRLGSLALMVAATVVVALIVSVVATAWAPRYLAMAVGPALLVGGLALARAGRAGLAIGAAIVVLGVVGTPAVWPKSNAREIAAVAAPLLRPGDLVASTQPEQVPVLAYALGTPGLRYVTPLGAVRDPGVTDWRDAGRRLATGTPARRLSPAVDALPVGATIILVTPRPWHGTTWARLIALRSRQWRAALLEDGRIRRLGALRPASRRGAWSVLRAEAFRKLRP